MTSGDTATFCRMPYSRLTSSTMRSHAGSATRGARAEMAARRRICSSRAPAPIAKPIAQIRPSGIARVGIRGAAAAESANAGAAATESAGAAAKGTASNASAGGAGTAVAGHAGSSHASGAASAAAAIVDREDPVAQRRRAVAEHDDGGDAHGEHQGRPDQRVCKGRHRGSLRAVLTRSAMRSRSSSDSRLPSPPSRAATTLAFEPSKKVSTRCFRADFRAEWRGTIGM